jgi:hypothetical protein
VDTTHQDSHLPDAAQKMPVIHGKRRKKQRFEKNVCTRDIKTEISNKNQGNEYKTNITPHVHSVNVP